MAEPIEVRKLQVGLFGLRRFRHLLDRLRFLGDVDDYFEDAGFIDSIFTIRFTTRHGLRTVLSWCQEMDPQ